MIFNNPISSEKADRFVRMLELRAGGRVLDAGCGTGEFLMRVVAHHGVNGTGVDRDAASINTARDLAKARGLSARCEFHAIDVNELGASPIAFDLAICIGSTHAFGAGDVAYPNAIAQLTQLVRPGGYLLIGEGYWKQNPPPEYLELIGDPVGIYRDHAGNVSFAEAHGLVPLYAAVASDDEWDHFEWTHRMNIERDAGPHPNDPQTITRLKNSRRWRDGYLRWGRSTMGFGIYLFRVPASSVGIEPK